MSAWTYGYYKQLATTIYSNMVEMLHTMVQFTSETEKCMISLLHLIMLCSKLRHIAYHQLVSWCWHHLGRKVRVVLPSCANLFFGPTFNLEIFQRLNNGWGYGRGFRLHWKRCGANTNGGGIESDCWREMAYRLLLLTLSRSATH